MLRELDAGEKDVASDLIKKAPGPPVLDFTIQNRLNKSKERNEVSSNNLSSPPSPHPSLFLPPQPPPPLSSLRSNQYVPPPQSPPLSNFNFKFLPPPPPPTFPSIDQLFGSHVMTKEKKEDEKEKVLDEIDDKIYELPDLPKLELWDQLLNILDAEVEAILEGSFVTSKELEEKTLENIKEEYNFDEIKDAFDDAVVPHQLEFFYDRDNDNFIRACNFLSINEDNNEFVICMF